MKIFRRNLLLVLIAALFVTLTAHQQSKAASFASANPDKPDDSSVSEFHGKKGIRRVMNWGLAKIENIFDQVVVSELITAFLSKCDHILQFMIHSFAEMTSSYTTLLDKETTRLVQFDKEFSELVKLRNKIERKCLVTRNKEERSVCVDKGVEIHDKIQDLRSRRLRGSANVERYNEMIEWCASYNNWFC